ncbi:uncharacterized protein EKO05_0003633 [Ascochyta rabiei]|uniref:uncharacterized protein n=1 Tax=Didymella rabiei TaxID=5454 RepID=UPI0018FFAF95|nr:uncharacterized protein EKO05_0003633 [Ascochyta rabiei]UPX13106.1 hypothetical protein EKO05_0003633 [Ascochyta rabiei]
MARSNTPTTTATTPTAPPTLDKETLHHHSTDSHFSAQEDQDPERLVARRRSLHGKVLIGGLVVTVVLGLALGLGLGLTVGRYGTS